MAPVTKPEARALFGPEGPVLEWLARRWAEPRPKPIPVRPPHPDQSPELSVWGRVFERYELEAADPAEAELRAPGDAENIGELLAAATSAGAVADLVAALTATTVIVEQDALAYLASQSGTSSGVSRVFAFHPEDWGLFPSDASISVRMYRLEESARRMLHPFGSGQQSRPDEDLDLRLRAALPVFESDAGTDPLASHLDPVRLFERTDWIVRLLAGVPYGRSIALAATLEAFEREEPLINMHTHLALYWLWAHALLDNRMSFERCLERTDGSIGLVRSARAALRRWVSGKTARLGPLDLRTFEALREIAREGAPASAVENEREPGAPNIEARDERASTFVDLFHHLSDASGAGPGPWRGHPENELESLLTQWVEPRFLPLLDAALAEGARADDHHRAAGRGRIVARAALCPSLAALDDALERAGGTSRFGPRRQDELWRAVARFSGPEADARLAAGAAAFAREAADWIRTASKVPWDALLARDTLETHELVARFLRDVVLTPVTVPLVLEAARAAERHGIRRAVPGLRRAASAGIGRLDDGGRALVPWAIIELDEEAGAFLRSLAGILTLEWEDADEESDALESAEALAAVVGPLLAVEPENLEVRATAAALFSRFAVHLGRERRPRARLLEALRALVEGTTKGEVHALAAPIRALARLEPKIGPAARPADARLRVAYARAFETLGR